MDFEMRWRGEEVKAAVREALGADPAVFAREVEHARTIVDAYQGEELPPDLDRVRVALAGLVAAWDGWEDDR